MLTRKFTLFMLTVTLVMIYWRIKAGEKKLPKIRRLPALDAFEEAVGRCAEMDRPFWASPGSGKVTTSSLAAMSMIAHIARLCARAGVKIMVCIAHPEMIPITKAKLEEAYASEGKIDETPEPYYFGGKQAYIVGGLGLMYREQAAGVFYCASGVQTTHFGEAGSILGALRIGGGTGRQHYPFLVTVYDYSILGEEIYAAGAYLNKDPHESGSIEGQDWARIIFMGLLAFTILFSLTGQADILFNLFRS